MDTDEKGIRRKRIVAGQNLVGFVLGYARDQHGQLGVACNFRSQVAIDQHQAVVSLTGQYRVGESHFSQHAA